jgi:hypothetical protein
MLGALAAVALVVGSISATVSVTQNDQQPLDQADAPVVEVQEIESLDSAADESSIF